MELDPHGLGAVDRGTAGWLAGWLVYEASVTDRASGSARPHNPTMSDTIHRPHLFIY